MTVVYGADIGLIHQQLNQLLNPAACKQVWFQDVNKLYDVVLNQNLFAEDTKPILIHNCSFLEKNNLTKAELHCLKTLKDTDVVVTIYSDSPANALINDRAITKYACKPVTAKTIHQVISKAAKTLKLNLNPDLIDHLATILPFNLGVIEQELRKLTLLSPAELQDKKMLEAVLCDYQTSQILQLTDAMVRLQTAKALKLIEGLFLPKELTPPQFLEFLANELLLALMVKGVKPQAVFQLQWNVNPFRLKAIQSQYRFWSTNQLTALINAIWQLDIKIKRNDGLAIHLLKHFVLRFFAQK